MSEVKNGPAEQEPAFSVDNARQFLGWMFPKHPLEQIAEIPDAYLPAIFSILEQKATARLELLKPLKKRQQMRPIDAMKRWSQGEQYQTIAEQTASTDDSVRFALFSFAQRLGEKESIDALVAQAPEKLAEMQAQAEEDAELAALLESQLGPEPEIVEVVEEASEDEPEQIEEVTEPPQEIGQIAVQEVVEEPLPQDEVNEEQEPEPAEEPAQVEVAEIPHREEEPEEEEEDPKETEQEPGTEEIVDEEEIYSQHELGLVVVQEVKEVLEQEELETKSEPEEEQTQAPPESDEPQPSLKRLTHGELVKQYPMYERLSQQEQVKMAQAAGIVIIGP